MSAFFSTNGGQFAPRAAGEGPVIARSDPKYDAALFIKELRTRWPHVCNSIFAPWDIRWFFDEHDFHTLGGRYLYQDVLQTMQQQNQDNVIRWSQEWSEANRTQFHAIMVFDTHTVFHQADHARWGVPFLERAHLHMKNAYQRAQQLEFIQATPAPAPVLPTPIFTPANATVVCSVQHQNGPQSAPPILLQWAPSNEQYGRVPYPGVGAWVPARKDGGMPIDQRGPANAVPGAPFLYDPHSNTVGRAFSMNQPRRQPAGFTGDEYSMAKRFTNNGRESEQDSGGPYPARKDSIGRGRGRKHSSGSRKSSMSFNDNSDRNMSDPNATFTRRNTRQPTLDRINEPHFERESWFVPVNRNGQSVPKNKAAGRRTDRPADIVVPDRIAGHDGRAHGSATVQDTASLVDLPPDLRVTRHSIGNAVDKVRKLFVSNVGHKVVEPEIVAAFSKLSGFQSIELVQKSPSSQSPGNSPNVYVYFHSAPETRQALATCKNRHKYSVEVPKHYWTHDEQDNRLDRAHQYEDPDRTAWHGFYRKNSIASPVKSPTKSRKSFDGRRASAASRQNTGSFSNSMYSPQDARSGLWPDPAPILETPTVTTEPQDMQDSPEALTPVAPVISASSETTKRSSEPQFQESMTAAAIPASTTEKAASSETPTISASQEHIGHSPEPSTAAGLADPPSDRPLTDGADSSKGGQTVSSDQISGHVVSSEQDSSHAVLPDDNSVHVASPDTNSGHVVPEDQLITPAVSSDQNLCTPEHTTSQKKQFMSPEPKPSLAASPASATSNSAIGSVRGSMARALKIVPALPKTFRDSSRAKSTTILSPAKPVNLAAAREVGSKTAPLTQLSTFDQQLLLHEENHGQTKATDNHQAAVSPARENVVGSLNVTTSLETSSEASTPVGASKRTPNTLSKRPSIQWPTGWRDQYEEIVNGLTGMQHETVQQWGIEAETLKDRLDKLDSQIQADEAKLASQPSKTMSKTVRKRLTKRTNDQEHESEEMLLLLGIIRNARTLQDAAGNPPEIKHNVGMTAKDLNARRYPPHEVSATMPWVKPREGNQQKSLLSIEGDMDGSSSLRLSPSERESYGRLCIFKLANDDTDKDAITDRVIEEVIEEVEVNSPVTLENRLHEYFKEHGEDVDSSSSVDGSGLGILVPQESHSTDSSDATGGAISPDHAIFSEDFRKLRETITPLEEQGFELGDFDDLDEQARSGIHMPFPDRTLEPPASPSSGVDPEPAESVLIDVSTEPTQRPIQELPEAVEAVDESMQHEKPENIRPAPRRQASTPSHMSYAKAASVISRAMTQASSVASPTTADSQHSNVLRRASNASQASSSGTRGGKGKGRATISTANTAPEGRPGTCAAKDWTMGPEGSWYTAPNTTSTPPSAWKPLFKGDQTKKGDQLRKGG